MYMSAKDLNRFDTARLISPTLRATPSSYRVNYWYHMYGRDMGTLRLYVRVNGKDTKVVLFQFFIVYRNSEDTRNADILCFFWIIF